MVAEQLGFKLGNGKEVFSSINKFNYHTFSTVSQRKKVANEILDAAKKHNVRYNSQQEFYIAAGKGVNRWI